MSRPGWEYDEQTDCWLWGEPNEGCGVGTDDFGDTYWANAVNKGFLLLVGSNYLTLEAAQRDAEEAYNDRKEIYND